MSALKGLGVRLRALLRGAEADRALDEEMQFHLDCETDKNMTLGMNPVEARRRALAVFGGKLRARDAHRDARGVRWTEEVVADVRYAVRTLVRSPVLTGAVLVTLALGIGANTAIFSAVNAVILQPLPFPAPDRLVMLWEQNPEKGWVNNVVAPANYLDWRAGAGGFQDIAAYFGWPSQATLVGRGEARLLTTAAVTGNFFSVLGVPAARGRVFREEETWFNAGPPVAVLSQRVWKDQFSSDTTLIGQTIQLDGQSVEVVGIMPAGFAFPWENVDAWLSVRWDPASRTDASFRRGHGLRAIARLKPGVTIARGNSELQVVVARLQRDYPATNRTMGAGMTPLHEFLVGDTRTPLLVLLGAVGLLLLIACANVGNLLLVRAAAREREMAFASGVGRWPVSSGTASADGEPRPVDERRSVGIARWLGKHAGARVVAATGTPSREPIRSRLDRPRLRLRDRDRCRVALWRRTSALGTRPTSGPVVERRRTRRERRAREGAMGERARGRGGRSRASPQRGRGAPDT